MELFISWGQCPGVGSLGCMVSECLGLNELPCCFPEWLPSLTFTYVMSVRPSFSPPSLAFHVVTKFYFSCCHR